MQVVLANSTVVRSRIYISFSHLVQWIAELDQSRDQKRLRKTKHL